MPERAGIALLPELIAQYRNIGLVYLLPLNLSALADAYGQMGHVEEGLTTIAEAVHITETSATAFWAAEVYRLKGELLLQSSAQSHGPRVKKGSKSKGQRPLAANPKPQILNPQSHEEAEACFQQAITIAQQQEAKSLELRATMSLARLWQQQGKGAKGHKLLSKIHAWFSEGFDTQDLREAKVLLDEL